MDYRFTDTPEEYQSFFWGENNVAHQDYEFIFHLDEPRCLIKFNTLEMFADLEDFLRSIVDVQWLDGVAPPPDAIDELLEKAWSFIIIEDNILEEDSTLEDEDFDDEPDEDSR